MRGIEALRWIFALLFFSLDVIFTHIPSSLAVSPEIVGGQVNHFKKVVLGIQDPQTVDPGAPVIRWRTPKIEVTVVSDIENQSVRKLLTNAIAFELMHLGRLAKNIEFQVASAESEPWPGNAKVRIYFMMPDFFEKIGVTTLESNFAHDPDVVEDGMIVCRSNLKYNAATGEILSAEIFVNAGQSRQRIMTCTFDRLFGALGFMGREFESPCKTIRCSEKERIRVSTPRDYASLQMLYAHPVDQDWLIGDALQELDALAQAARKYQ